MYQTYRPLLDALISRGARPEAIEDAAARAEVSGRTIRDVLINDAVVTEMEMTVASAEASGITSVDLLDYSIDSAALTMLPLPLVLRHRVLGIDVVDGELVVATSDPEDVVALDDVQAASPLPVRLVVAARSELRRLIDRVKRSENTLGDLAAGVEESAGEVANLADGGEDAPIVRYVNSLLEQAIQARASDLHLEPYEHEMRVRFRIDGVLHVVDTVPQNVQPALVSRLKIMSAIDITERRVPQNGRLTVRLNQRNVDLRVATMPTVWGEKIVLRVLDTKGLDLRLRSLGFSDASYDRFSTSFRKPHGMVLVTGPTGSGKSTTLYATLGEIVTPQVNVITVEDPVEYRLEGINQVQVNIKAGVTFAAVLPAILRSDPDVVMIGEIRDRATAQLAVEAALTGHLVLSTLHTNDAPAAATRLVEMGIEPFLVGSALDSVLAQRLARRLCEWCKAPASGGAADSIAWPAGARVPEPETLWRPQGCRNCGGTGYNGRIALTEVMTVTEEVEHLVLRRAPASEVRRTALDQGMTSLRDDGLATVAAGHTTLEEVLRVTV